MPLPLIPTLAPMLLSGGIGAAGQLVEALPAMLPTKHDKYNRKQMERLEALANRNALGLTANQRSDIRSSIVNPTAKAVSDLQQLTPRDMNGTSMGSAALQQQLGLQALGQQTAQANALAERQIRAADEAKKNEQRQELEDRMFRLSQRRTEQLAAGLSLIPAAGKPMADRYNQSQLTGPGAPAELTNQTNAQMLFQQYSNDPEMLEIIMQYGMGGS